MPATGSQCPDLCGQFRGALKAERRELYMHGSITRVSRKDGSGSILAEDGKEVHFEASQVDANAAKNLKVGYGVEFELQYGFEQAIAVNVRRFDGNSGRQP
jgi:cold shock CspA family protein